MGRFTEELKRRGVVRVAVVYLGGAFAVLQGGDVLAGMLELPSVALNVLAAVLLLGFPVALLLTWTFAVVPEVSKHAAAPLEAQSWISGRVIATAVVLVGLGALFGYAFGRTDELPVDLAHSLERLSVVLPDGATLVLDDRAGWGTWNTSTVGLSADGSTLAYVGSRPDGQTQIFTRTMNGFGVTPVDGTVAAQGPFFSPDGRWLGFTRDGQVFKVPSSGGSALPLGEVVSSVSFGSRWLPDDRILFAENEGKSFFWMSSDGSGVTPIAGLQAAAGFDIDPSGRFVVHDNHERELLVTDLATGETSVLVREAFGPELVGDRYLVFIRGDDLWGIHVDLRTASTSGAPVLLERGVLSWGRGQLWASDEGELAYVPGKALVGGRLTWIDVEGRLEPITPEQRFGQLQLSPDGQRVAYNQPRQIIGFVGDIITLDLADGTQRRLTQSGNYLTPAWSEDGAFVYYASQGSSSTGIHRRVADGSRPEERLLESQDSIRVESVHGDTVIFSTANAQTSQLFMLVGSVGEVVEVTADTTRDERHGRLSPNRKWLSYTLLEGRFELEVRAVDGSWGPLRVSAEGGEEAFWSADGSTLYFKDEQRLYEVRVRDLGKALDVGTPREVAYVEAIWNLPGFSFSRGTDGRFLAVVGGFPERNNEIRILRGLPH
jgi:serine/threonine-protein kinase